MISRICVVILLGLLMVLTAWIIPLATNTGRLPLPSLTTDENAGLSPSGFKDNRGDTSTETEASAPTTRSRTTPPSIDVDNPDTPEDHDGWRVDPNVIYKEGQASPDQALVTITLQGEGDPVQGGDVGYAPLDCVFVVDTTGSMTPYIEQAKANMDEIVAQLEANGVTDMRFGIVTYKEGYDTLTWWDIYDPNGDAVTFEIILKCPLTDYDTFASVLSTVTAQYGTGSYSGRAGILDGLEVGTGIHYGPTDYPEMNWEDYRDPSDPTTKVAKVVVLLGDAPGYCYAKTYELGYDAYEDEYGIHLNTIACDTSDPWEEEFFQHIVQGNNDAGGAGVFSTSDDPTYVANAITESILLVVPSYDIGGKNVEVVYTYPDWITPSDFTPAYTSHIGNQVTWNFDSITLGGGPSITFNVKSSLGSDPYMVEDIDIGDLVVHYDAWNGVDAFDVPTTIYVDPEHGYVEPKLTVRELVELDICLGNSGYIEPSDPQMVPAGGTQEFNVHAYDQYGDEMNPDMDAGSINWFTTGGPTAWGTITSTTGFNTVFEAPEDAGNSGTLEASAFGIEDIVNIVIGWGPEDHFGLSLPPPGDNPIVGIPFDICVSVYDEFGNIVEDYYGTIQFSATPSAGMEFPSGDTHEFLLSYNGEHTYEDILMATSVDTFTITVTSTTHPDIEPGTITITIEPGEATEFIVSAPSIVYTGVSFSITVEAIDMYGYTATGYTGTVTFSTNAGIAPDGISAPSLPPDYTFDSSDAGVHTFSVTLYKAETDVIITVQDVDYPSITGSSDAITVEPGSLAYIVILPSSPEIHVGSTYNFEAEGYDLYENPWQFTAQEPVDWSIEGEVVNAGPGDAEIQSTGIATAEFTAPSYIHGPSVHGSVSATAEGITAETILTVINHYDISITAPGDLSPKTVLEGSSVVDLYARIHYYVPSFVFTDEDGNPSTPETYTIPINFELDGVAVATADLVLTEGDITGETIVNALYTGTPLSKGVHTYRVYFADQKETTGELFEAHDSTVGTNNNEATIELEVIKPGARASQSFAPPIFIVLLILGVLAVIYSIFAYPQYRRLRLLLRRDREGVSPVIAVILMVGITIIIIAILWMWIYSFIPTAKETPERYDAEVKLDDNGDYTIMIKTAKKPVSVLDCRFYLKDPTGKTMALPHKEVRSIYNKELTPTYPVVYHDNDLYGKISTHDTFEIRGLSNGGPGQPDGKLILVYKPTGGIILEARLQ